MPERKIDDSDLSTLRDIRERNNRLTYEIGEMAIARADMRERMDAIDAKFQELVKEVRQLDENAAEIGRSLQKKYGEGTFDLERGVFEEDAP